MYQMLTSHVPYESTVAQMTQEPAPPDQEVDMPAAMSGVIMLALSIDPRERPSAAEVTRILSDMFQIQIPLATTPPIRVEHVVDTSAPTEERDVSTGTTVVQRPV